MDRTADGDAPRHRQRWPDRFGARRRPRRASGSRNGRLRCTGRAAAWRTPVVRAGATLGGSASSGTAASWNQRTDRPYSSIWSIVWGAPTPRSSGGRSAVSTIIGTSDRPASTTAGWKLAAAVPLVHSSTAGHTVEPETECDEAGDALVVHDVDRRARCARRAPAPSVCCATRGRRQRGAHHSAPIRRRAWRTPWRWRRRRRRSWPRRYGPTAAPARAYSATDGTTPPCAAGRRSASRSGAMSCARGATSASDGSSGRSRSCAGEIEVDVTLPPVPARPDGTPRHVAAGQRGVREQVRRARTSSRRSSQHVTDVAAGDGHRVPPRPGPAGQHPARPPPALARRATGSPVAAAGAEGAVAAGLLRRGPRRRRPRHARRLRRRGRLRSPMPIVAFLDSDRGVAEVRADLELAAELGITAVPTFVIDGRWAIPGAQDTRHVRHRAAPRAAATRRAEAGMTRPMATALVFLHGFTQTHHHWHAVRAPDRARASAPPDAGVRRPPGPRPERRRPPVDRRRRHRARRRRRAGHVRRLLDGWAVRASPPPSPGRPRSNDWSSSAATGRDRRPGRTGRRRRARTSVVRAGSRRSVSTPSSTSGSRCRCSPACLRRPTIGATGAATPRPGWRRACASPGAAPSTRLWDALASVTIPVLVLAGEHDAKFTEDRAPAWPRPPERRRFAVDPGGRPRRPPRAAAR